MEDSIQQGLRIAASSSSPSLAENNTGTSSTNAIVNTYVLTLFNYQNNQVYVYSPKSNTDENKSDYRKWIFYYVPVMLPLKQDENDTKWIWAVRNEIRLKLIVSNKEIEELAREAISNKFDNDIVKNYSKYWDVAPLMIDSLMAYILRADSSPVVGVQQYHAIHPTTLIMTLRFQCTTEIIAQETVEKIIDGDYEIEVALYFAEFKQVKMNLASITGDQVRSVLSKTIADGGDTNSQYIHRNQAAHFVGKYVTNVKKMIYIEDASLDTSTLTAGLEDQFFSLFQQGMENSETTEIEAGLYGQIWSSSDLNPNRLTTEIENLFTKNDSETQRRNDSNTYYNLNTQYLKESTASNEASASVSGSGWGFSAAISGSTSSSSSNSLQNQLAHTTHDIFSKDDIDKLFTEQQVELKWEGEKFIPKKFKVYKLIDLTSQLQVAIIAKQFSVDKNRGAIIRTINTLNTLSAPILKNSTKEPKPTKISAVFLTGTRKHP
ncbi:unnamed protein product [Rotaria sp. Silwood2]|nr:unnamed protein product [Rotaria sp. Silwood2]CAF3202557.1 unnamed protein product [Rotaria sp. Silwood2]CAF4584341.1 unnamed protein product [Rotaria sp. Silwood2]